MESSGHVWNLNIAIVGGLRLNPEMFIGRLGEIVVDGFFSFLTSVTHHDWSWILWLRNWRHLVRFRSGSGVQWLIRRQGSVRRWFRRREFKTNGVAFGVNLSLILLMIPQSFLGASNMILAIWRKTYLFSHRRPHLVHV